MRPLLFRSPYGAFCRSLEAALTARGLPDIGWNIDPQDWKSDDEEAVFAYLTNKRRPAQGRGILLLHDTHSASVHALPRLLDWLARENARAVRAQPRARQRHRLPRARPAARRSPPSGLPSWSARWSPTLRGSVARHLP